MPSHVKHKIKCLLLNQVNKALGFSRRNAVRVFWFNNRPNFGDQFTPELLKEYGLTPVHSSLPRCDVISTGSVLQQTESNFGQHILGSGLIDDREIDLRNARIWGVRGRLTQERVQGAENAILGDPGCWRGNL